jgi:D-glycero-alpha-D-manno-heptose-7-phosphate kinase
LIISKTPLRVSFAGGGSDLPSYYQEMQGSVISTSINKYIYVILKKRFDNLIYINYSKKEIVDKVKDIKHDLVREAMIKTGINSGIEITTLSDVPSSGSGLGSSSSVTVGLLNAMYNYQNILKSKEDLANEACIIEIDICNHPIGKQDQYACSIGGMNRINFEIDGSVNFNPINVNLKKLNRNLYLCFTGLTRDANIILNEQSNRSKENKKRNIEIVKSVDVFEKIIQSGKLNEIGPFLDEMWKVKQKMATNISNNKIKEIYEKGIQSGSTGGKVLGAGGGGFILFYVPRDNQIKFENEMRNFHFVDFNLENHGTKVIFVG